MKIVRDDKKSANKGDFKLGMNTRDEYEPSWLEP